jgi:hypothetical protein
MQLLWFGIVTCNTLTHPGLPPLNCANDETYYAQARFCLPKAFISDELLAILLEEFICPGGTFRSQAELEKLRFCSRITSSIIVRDIDGAIDSSVFWDITFIEGRYLYCCLP